ncbi:hypothetical protein D3C81_2143250 [compost metagenome]
MLVSSLTGEQHGGDDVVIQCTNVQNHSSGHGSDISNFFMRISHERRGAQGQQAVRAEVGDYDICNVMNKRIAFAYFG